MNAVTPFLFENDNLIRVVMQNDEPWFVAVDVCRCLEIKNSRDAISTLDEDEKGVALTDTLGGTQEVSIISESGLYTLILRSRKAMTQGTVQHRFRKWVTADLLPSIRKTGGYGHQQGHSSEHPAANQSKGKYFLSLLNRLDRTTDPEVRKVLYAMLEATAQSMGMIPPPLANCVKRRPTRSNQVISSWEDMRFLMELGLRSGDQ